jgi:hypothetical protein
MGRRPGDQNARLQQLSKQKRWEPADAGYVLDTWRRSGLSQAAFSKQNGIGVWRIREWKERLNGQETAPDVPRFLPVHIKPDDRDNSETVDWDVEFLVPSGLRLRIRQRLDVGTLAALVGALERSAC